MPPTTAPVLIAGQWRPSDAAGTFTATDPKTGRPLPTAYPVSGRADLEAALAAAASAAEASRAMPDAGVRLADFLEQYADAIEANAATIAAAAAEETGLPVAPRLKDVELPRTTGQLRQAAHAARHGTWLRPTIDTKAGLRSCLAPIGPVLTIGPNNFPLAYNGISGGDFASALAAGNPIIAKAHPLHPAVSRLLAEAAHAAATNVGLPPGTVQMVYHMSPDDGLRLVRDPRLAAVGFTGGRRAGLALKAAADTTGTLFYGEMSSLNPTVLLPAALDENAAAIAEQFAISVLMGTGQFCTKPGLVLLVAGVSAEAFVADVKARLSAAAAGTLFSDAGRSSLTEALKTLTAAGADVVTGGDVEAGDGYRVQNTLLRTTAERFLADAKTFQTEAFGSAALVVTAADLPQLLAVVATLDGNLTGTIYSAQDGRDDAAYTQVAAALRPKVGRLINDKMPTGVAVTAAQQHGGPYPATTQPHFTAVGIPASITRFTQLQAYDNVRDDRLPPCLQGKNPVAGLWRMINEEWTQGDV